MLESDDWARIGGGWDKKDRTVRERLRVVNNVGRSDGIPPIDGAYISWRRLPTAGPRTDDRNPNGPGLAAVSHFRY